MTLPCDTFLLCSLIAALAIMTVPSVLSLLECAVAHRADRARAAQSESVSFTVVIAAYLPNEQAIILDTMRYFAVLLADGSAHALILVYNTPVDLPVEQELRDFASCRGAVRVLRVEGSRSKAANLNAALGHVRTDAVAFFDSDARPEPGSLRLASAWLAAGYDAVQGVNRVRTSDRWLTRLVYTECLIKYQISYLARFRAANVVYFTGSNGYWRASVLRALRFRDGQQVEDIDIALRAILAGASIVFDPEIVATEEAPPSLGAWWIQRVRWAQGWAQLLRCHQWRLLGSGTVRGRCRLVWTYFLLFRRLVMPACVVTVCTGLTAQALLQIPPASAEVVAGSLLYAAGFAAALAPLFVLRRQAGARLPKPLWYYPLLFPLYDLVREVTIVRGSLALFVQPRRWRVTPRFVCKNLAG